MQGIRYETFNIKSEEVKFNAFFQYLKSFSETGLDTLQKLETQFNKEMRSKLKHSQTLATIKNLLSSYEIFILCILFCHVEIKDSCDFVQISEFGYCIGKAFLQLLKIIKWFLKTWLKDSRKYEKLKASFQTDQNMQGDGIVSSEDNVCSFCEEVIKSNPYGKDMRNKRKGRAMVDIGSELREAKKNYKTEVNHLMNFKDQILQKYVFIPQKRLTNSFKILNRKQVAMKLQMSNNQSVLEEVLNQFNLKTEAMARFVSTTQAICIEDFRLNHDSDYSHFQEQMKQVINQKFQEAKLKMKELVQARINDYQKHKKDKLTHAEVQTMPIPTCDQEKGQFKLKQLGVALQKMKNELESQKALTQSLRKLLQSKSVEFEKQFIKYRKQVFDKSKHLLKSLKSFKQIIKQQQEQEKASIEIIEDSTEFAVKKPTRKIISGLMNNDKSKKIHSIKFTFNNNEEAQIDNTSLIAKNSNAQSLSQSIICYEDNQKRSVEVQTEAINLQQESDNPQNTIGGINKIYRNESFRPKSLFKQIRKEKIGQQKSQTQLYAHIRSKIFEPKEIAKPVRKELKPTRSSFMGNLAKRLAPESILAETKQNNEPIKCFKITSDPLFSICSHFYFNRSDLYNIFIDDKHAYLYECIIYKNCVLNFANLNPKRAIPNSACVQVADMESIFKKDFIVNDNIQAKLLRALHQQLCLLKRKYGIMYEQVKQILRSPFQVSKKIDVIQLQKIQVVDKDIDVNQLKKMINLLMRFHAECGGEQGAVCEHIIKFYDKLGVKFKQ